MLTKTFDRRQLRLTLPGTGLLQVSTIPPSQRPDWHSSGAHSPTRSTCRTERTPTRSTPRLPRCSVESPQVLRPRASVGSARKTANPDHQGEGHCCARQPRNVLSTWCMWTFARKPLACSSGSKPARVPARTSVTGVAPVSPSCRAQRWGPQFGNADWPAHETLRAHFPEASARNGNMTKILSPRFPPCGLQHHPWCGTGRRSGHHSERTGPGLGTRSSHAGPSLLSLCSKGRLTKVRRCPDLTPPEHTKNHCIMRVRGRKKCSGECRPPLVQGGAPHFEAKKTRRAPFGAGGCFEQDGAVPSGWAKRRKTN